MGVLHDVNYRGEIDFANARLVIRGPTGDAERRHLPPVRPEELTELLGLQPTYTSRHSDIAYDAWHLSSSFYIISHNLIDHLTWLIQQLVPLAERIHAYLDGHNASAEIICLQDVVSTGSLRVTTALLHDLATLNLPLDIELTGLSEAENEENLGSPE